MPIYVHRLINLHFSCGSSKTGGGSDFLGIAVLGLATIFQAPVPCYYVKSAKLLKLFSIEQKLLQQNQLKVPKVKHTYSTVQPPLNSVDFMQLFYIGAFHVFACLLNLACIICMYNIGQNKGCTEKKGCTDLKSLKVHI